VQLAKLAGMTAIGLVGTDEKVHALKAFGADHAINYRKEDVAARVAAITGGAGVDLVLNAAGGDSLTQQIAMLAPFGLAVSYGKLEAPHENELLAALDRGPGYLSSPALRFFTMHTFDDKPAYRAESMRYLIERLAAGDIKPLIHAKLPLKDARRAHEMLEAREVIGKVLLKP
jgi:NADPH2:quinone reductase